MYNFQEILHQLQSWAEQQPMTRELQATFKAELTAQLEKLELVTLEEFEAQQAVLTRTREKLENLEKRIDALEIKQASDSEESPDTST